MKNNNCTLTAWASWFYQMMIECLGRLTLPRQARGMCASPFGWRVACPPSQEHEAEVPNFRWGSEHDQKTSHQSLYEKLAAFLSHKSRNGLIPIAFNLFPPESLASSGMLQLPLEWLTFPHTVRNLAYLQNFRLCSHTLVVLTNSSPHSSCSWLQ